MTNWDFLLSEVSVCSYVAHHPTHSITDNYWPMPFLHLSHFTMHKVTSSNRKASILPMSPVLVFNCTVFLVSGKKTRPSKIARRILQIYSHPPPAQIQLCPSGEHFHVLSTQSQKTSYDSRDQMDSLTGWSIWVSFLKSKSFTLWESRNVAALPGSSMWHFQAERSLWEYIFLS